jgi:hypothetical protein
MIEFGQEHRTLFAWLNNCSKGANLVCTMLLQQILALKTSTGPSAAARKLICQFDGGSENINQ